MIGRWSATFRFEAPGAISLLSSAASDEIDVPRQAETLASLWKIPWVRRQRTRLRRPLQILLSPVLANYIKLVIKTSTMVADPPDYVGRARELHPSIIALWHGQFFLLPGLYPRDIPARAIVRTEC